MLSEARIAEDALAKVRSGGLFTCWEMFGPESHATSAPKTYKGRHQRRHPRGLSLSKSPDIHPPARCLCFFSTSTKTFLVHSLAPCLALLQVSPSSFRRTSRLSSVTVAARRHLSRMLCRPRFFLLGDLSSLGSLPSCQIPDSPLSRCLDDARLLRIHRLPARQLSPANISTFTSHLPTATPPSGSFICSRKSIGRQRLFSQMHVLTSKRFFHLGLRLSALCL